MRSLRETYGISFEDLRLTDQVDDLCQIHGLLDTNFNKLREDFYDSRDKFTYLDDLIATHTTWHPLSSEKHPNLTAIGIAFGSQFLEARLNKTRTKLINKFKKINVPAWRVSLPNFDETLSKIKIDYHRPSEALETLDDPNSILIVTHKGEGVAATLTLDIPENSRTATIKNISNYSNTLNGENGSLVMLGLILKADEVASSFAEIDEIEMKISSHQFKLLHILGRLGFSIDSETQNGISRISKSYIQKHSDNLKTNRNRKVFG